VKYQYPPRSFTSPEKLADKLLAVLRRLRVQEIQTSSAMAFGDVLSRPTHDRVAFICSSIARVPRLLA
jgi:hypothetical protein